MRQAPFLQHWLGYLRGPTMGLVLGADSCRLVVAGEDEVFCEPSICWRRRDDHRILLEGGSIGYVATQTLVCKNVEDYELARPLADPAPVESATLAAFLRYFRGRMAGHRRGRFPGKLLVTGRWDLRKIIEPMLVSVSPDVGFRSCRTVDESETLGLELGAAPGLTLVADAGHLGTRLYAWRGGVYVSPAGKTEAGGDEMLRAIQAAMGKRGLRIGDMTARRLFSKAGAAEGWPDEVGGRDDAADRPRCVEVGRQEVLTALEPVHGRIAEVCLAAVGRMRSGSDEPVQVVLAGGAATGPLEESLRKRAGVNVRLLPDPGAASARGLRAML